MVAMEQYTAQIFSIGNGIIDYALAIEWPRVVVRLKVFSFILSASALGAIIWTLKKHREVLITAAQKIQNASADKPPETSADRDEKRFIGEEWGRVKKLWTSHSLEERRLALIEADALLDNTLRDRGAKGESLAERLTHPASPRFAHAAEVVFAHAFRNELVHEAGATLDPIDAERAFAAYTNALKELKVI